MILVLSKRQLLFLFLFFIASLLCPNMLRAETMSLLNLEGFGARSPLSSLECRLVYPVANGVPSDYSVYRPQRSFNPFLILIHKKIIHGGACSSRKVKNLLMDVKNLLEIDTSSFFSGFSCKSVKNEAIFLFAVFVVYSPLFRGEREVEK